MTPHIFIHIRGGLVEDVLSQTPLDFTIIDYDIQGAEADSIVPLPQGDGTTQRAYVSAQSASILAPQRAEELHHICDAPITPADPAPKNESHTTTTN
jgi:hypothetical protein